MLEIAKPQAGEGHREEATRARRSWRDLVPLLEAPIRQGVWRALQVFVGEATPDQVEDLVQDVYCRLLEDGARRLRFFRGSHGPELTCYVRLTARRVVLDHIRAANALKRGGHLMKTAPLGEDPADSGPTPEEQAMISEARQEFLRGCRRAVGPRNADRDLAILELIYLEGWTSREVAYSWPEPLSVSSVDSLVFRVRKKLALSGISMLPRDGKRRRKRGPAGPWSRAH